MALSNYSKRELEEELERREREEEKPVFVDNPNLENLKALLQQYIDNIASGNYVDDDEEHYIFEEALKAFFGKDVFYWVNENC